MASYTTIRTRRAKNQAFTGRGHVRPHHLACIALAALALLALSAPQAPAGFPAPLCFETGPVLQSAAVGDFNRDGMLDLAVTNGGDANGKGMGVSILLGNGDGTFQSAVNYPAGSSPGSVVVADLNGDGFLDLAVTNYGGTVNVLLGNGDGTFQAAQIYKAGSAPVSVAIGDFNGDGILDLVVANEGTYPNYTDGGVSILLGNGDGTFQAAQKYEAGASPICVALGDFNGDGIPDLAVSNPSESVVHVLLGNGDGTFQTYPISYLRQGVCNSLAVGDFNGDGRADLAAACVTSNGLGSASILINDGIWVP